VKKLILAGLISAMPLMAASAQEIALDTDEDKLSYSLGMLVGERVLKNYGDSLNYEAITAAMTAQHSGEETQLTIEEAQQVLGEFEEKLRQEAAAAAVATGQKFLDENAARDEVTVTESGLQWEELEAADGAKPSIDDTVTVHYVGTLMDGTEFDSSIARGQPAEFPLKGVIAGWTEGLQLMNVGSKFRFVIPSDLAYGERGAGQNIGPNETLVFSVELLEIKGQ
jgi:FKBP-type peptidyl-prolyl cis-trans isomerase